jgi:hypothetical protein
MNYLRTPFLILAACGSALAAEGWTDLFNGENLDGWVQRGGKATYNVEDGTIVGTSTLNTPTSYLCTEKTYGDFTLEFDFKVNPKLNSGLQFRSEYFNKNQQVKVDGKTKKIPAGSVFGYQVEIDAEPDKDRWWSGGIYDQSRRGWIYPGKSGGDAASFTKQGREIIKQNDWNHVRVEAVGDSIKTFLNGKPCADLKDSLTLRGFFALQVHTIGKDKDKDGLQVRWRNLRIQEMTATEPNTLTAAEEAAGWKLLWDGKTTEGWRSAHVPNFPKGGWKMENGILIVSESGGAESAAAGDIITRDKFSDFELSVDFKITSGANSGIKIFVNPSINPGEGSAIGPEFQILDDVGHPDAKLGRDGNRTIGSLYDMITAPTSKKVNPIGEWNNARILSDDKHVTFFLNGAKTVEFERGSKEWRDLVATSKYSKWNAFGELAEGHILLQDHGNQVFYKNIKIRDFSKK